MDNMKKEFTWKETTTKMYEVRRYFGGGDIMTTQFPEEEMSRALEQFQLASSDINSLRKSKGLGNARASLVFVETTMMGHNELKKREVINYISEGYRANDAVAAA